MKVINFLGETLDLTLKLKLHYLVPKVQLQTAVLTPVISII